MKAKFYLPLIALLFSCNNSDKKETTSNDSSKSKVSIETESDFVFQTDQFADLRILRYQVPGFTNLKPQQKELLYYLYEAALCGRDIIWDQNCKYNLTVRKFIENAISTFKGNKESEDYKKFITYAKRIWFSNGIHHHYSSDKILPEFSSPSFLDTLILLSDKNGLPLEGNESVNEFSKRIGKIILDPTYLSKKVSLDPKKDLITSSAVNMYEGLTQIEASTFYTQANKNNVENPVMIGLNSKLLKKDGKIEEKKWMVGGMYTKSIEKIVYWLEKASAVAETNEQKSSLEKLIKFYKTGDLKDFDDYSIAWVKDVNSPVDVVNGFIETYNDPLGFKGSFESVVSVKDMEASKRISMIGSQAQWFEDNSPLLPEHKKKNVTGISAKVINVVIESGDAAPSTPIGINLPNNEWIREKHGSKSVNLGNIVEAYDRASGASVIDEFYFSKEIADRVKKCAAYADKLHTDMHEVIGHASGQIESGVGQPSETLKNYASTLEEARADLVALYYLYDKKLVDMGVMESLEYGKASYDEYITKGLLVQLARLKEGNDLEEAHMRNRHLVAAWVLEKGKKDNVLEMKVKDGKTYYVVNDYDKLKLLFGELLKEIQRIKSKGDYKAGRNLVEKYGVKVERKLHREVLDRYGKLNIAPYAGFIQPKLTPIFKEGKIIDVQISYPKDFVEQMMEYGKNYSLLPVMN